MAFEVVMPRLGWNMEEGAVVGWRRKDGDLVAAGEVLFEVESDKAVQEVEAVESGILRFPPESPALGTQVPVGTLLAWLLAPDEKMPPSSAPSAPAVSRAASGARPAAASTAASPSVSPPPAPAAGPAGSHTGEGPRAPGGRRVRISPRARRAARELGLDWTVLSGSGSSGRIVERDVRHAAAAGSGARVPGVGVRAPVPVAGTLAPGEALSISAVRRLTAERMTAGAHSTAPVTLTTEADATDLVRLRGQLKEEGAAAAPSYNDIFAKIAAHALVEHPQLNARFEGDSIVRSSSVHIAIAVDTDRGLIAPVVRDVQAKPLRQVARESAELIARARDGHARAEELRGGTFTITNLGMYEIDAFTPIINVPDCAILGVGRIVARQVVTDAEAGQVAIRRMVVLSLTFDHRLVDGAPAARFLQAIKRFVEKPYLWLAGR
ncbi:MAG: dihydrolipoamide acetyltransferase family protein [Spirochaetia bacterium]